jgi:hypothetical protein
VRYDLDPDRERKKPPTPAPEQSSVGREHVASAIGNSAMARLAAAPQKAPAPVLARFSASALAQRPTGALAEEEAEQVPEAPHETPPAPSSGPTEAPAAEPETIEPVEDSEPGSYNVEEESYL